VGYPVCSPYINWQLFYEYLHQDYIILYHTSSEIAAKQQPEAYYKDMFIDCTNLLTEGELAQISDVIIDDFNAEVIKYIKGKELFIYIPDYRWHCSSIEDYKKTTKKLRKHGFIFESTDSLISAIKLQKSSVFDAGLENDYREICRHLD
jgi:hypothetical protein